jgi:hypothetical protein
MIEIDAFYNQGFGWICKRCEQDLKTEATYDNENRPRVWREGEAESKETKLSAPIAKWLNVARTQLICPRCGITEIVNKA